MNENTKYSKRYKLAIIHEKATIDIANAIDIHVMPNLSKIRNYLAYRWTLNGF